jgi:hypothetical protein
LINIFITIPKAFGFEAATRRGVHAIITEGLFNSIVRSLDCAFVPAVARTAAALGMTGGEIAASLRSS